MAWRSEVDEHKGEGALLVLIVILFVSLIVTCARADKREEDLVGRLCARGDESACIELAIDEAAEAEGGRER